MTLNLRRTIRWLFYIVAFLPPLVFLPYTSELFEFNKVIVVYTMTILIVSTWTVRIITERRIIFTRTLLDIPLLLFIVSQFISTILSIDPFTSLYGYPSRFHGGLLSTISYSLLYWAFVSNLRKKEAKTFVYALLASASLVSIYGILQHYGIDDHIWHQDVKNRIFSTLGQPNWLAAWITPILFISTVLALESNKEKFEKRYFIFLVLVTVFYTTLLFTKSRSGILSFAVSFPVFLVLLAIQFRKNTRIVIQKLVPVFLTICLLTILIGTPWSPKLFTKNNPSPTVTPQDVAQSEGGTDSAVIRKIVWKGALDVWKNYPVFGTGVETFAYSYYQYRPHEHNLVSEWDFLYNKAHNEFLNTAANSGTFGLGSYFILTFGSILFISVLLKKSIGNSYLNVAFIASLISIAVTNFFGFSVVPVAIEYFLFPAVAFSLSITSKKSNKKASLTGVQKLAVVVVMLILLTLLFRVSQYWYSDILYARGKALNLEGEYVKARENLSKAIEIMPSHPFYYSELSESTAGISVALIEAGNEAHGKSFAEQSESEAYKATTLNPMNPNIYRSYAGVMLVLSNADLRYLQKAIKAYETALSIAPNDPKLYYRLGLTYSQIGENSKAIESLQKSIELKPDYGIARYTLALVYKHEEKFDEAREHLEYILENISAEDELVRQTLKEIEENSDN